MFFLFTEPVQKPNGSGGSWSCELIRIRISEDENALVAFRTRELGDSYFNPMGIWEGIDLIGEEHLSVAARQSLIGEPVLEFQDEFMMEEIRRRGCGFPFCEFVKEYSLDSGSGPFLQ